MNNLLFTGSSRTERENRSRQRALLLSFIL